MSHMETKILFGTAVLPRFQSGQELGLKIVRCRKNSFMVTGQYDSEKNNFIIMQVFFEGLMYIVRTSILPMT